MADLDGAGGAKTFTFDFFTDTSISNFGAFGTGAAPADSAELDTLALDIVAANLLLEQVGTSVVVSVADDPARTGAVTLEDTTVEQLDNIAGAGNFLFTGQSKITDGIDVWSAAVNGPQVFRPSIVTFLNALDNKVSGFDEGNDVINGLAGNDTLNGRAGNDLLRGGEGHDTLIGGLGNDRMFGGEGDDNLAGGRGDDLLDGGTGDDFLAGGRGNDIYVVDSLGDTILEDQPNAGGGGSADEVRASISFDLSSHARIENLTLTGKDDIDGTGNSSANVITGNAGDNILKGSGGNDSLRGGEGDDVLDGGKGNDRLEGGTGNDTYIVDSTSDVVVEGTPNSKNGGWADDVQSSVSFSINGLRNIERLTLTGSADIKGTGNDNANTITGNVGKNLISAGDGNDRLQGDAGDDTLNGGTGADTLTGGAGNDMIDGGTWTDTAVFSGVKGGYVISKVADDVHVVDIDFSDGDDGADHLANVEFLQFKDGKLAVSAIVAATIVDADAAGDSVTENSPNGTSVGITAAVKDGLGDIVFSLTDSAGGLFAIDEVTGVVTVADGQSLDHEANAERSITVRATVEDTGSFIEKSITIAIEDVAGDGLSNIDLLALAPEHGFRIPGARAYDQSGNSVSFAGDFNGDGIDDLIVGASYAKALGRDRAGESYLIFGKSGGSGDVDLATLTASEGFKISGAAASDYSGWDVSAAGDINGDGFDDLIVGGYHGRSHVIFGSDSGPGNIDLGALTAAQGFEIVGTAASSMSVSSAGDIDGDGIDDLIVGIARADDYGVLAGRSYVIYGAVAGLGNIDLDALAPSQGFKIAGAAPGDRSGASVSAAGDINGDGIDDLIVGAPSAPGPTPYAGDAYVIYGQKSGLDSIDLAALTQAEGFKISGGAPGDVIGRSVNSADDLNGDGINDLIVGSSTADPYGRDLAGQSFVIYGTKGGREDIDLATLTVAEGFKISGVAVNDRSGVSVSAAGDVNGDGVDDIIVGAPYADPSGRDYAGQSYLVYGKARGIGDIDLAALTASQGFKISGGATRDFSGTSVSAAGDINGDGFDDLIVGARRADPLGRPYAGESAVIYGGNFTKSVANLGTDGDDVLPGGSGEAFVGGLGNDVLGNPFGDGNAFHGGAGDDVILAGTGQFGDPIFVDGGGGIDTLKASEFGNSIDLTGSLRDRVQSIEILDLEGFASISLTLDSSNVTHMSGSNGSAFGPNTILVKGDGVPEGDVVTLADSGWAVDGEVTDPFGQKGTYTRWINGEATALIETEVTVLAIGDIDLADLSPAQGFTITGVASGDHAGTAVSMVGDVNDDGIDDFIVGASGADPASGLDAGQSYVTFGKAGGLSDIDLASLTASQGFKISGGAAGDAAGNSVSDAGDVNGDGIADLIVGAVGADPLGRPGAGETYVIYGKIGGPGDIDLATLTPAQGFAIAGVTDYSHSANTVRSAGDVNGDGIDDIILSAPSSLYQNGTAEAEAYVIYGKIGGLGDIDLRTLTSAQGFRLVNDSTTHFVSGVGDLNGDGFDDVAVGAGAGSPGYGYVIYGRAGIPAVVDLRSLSDADGFEIAPFDMFTESFGLVVSDAGDINGDGFQDLAVADAEQGPYSGRTAVIYGKAGGPGDIDLSALTLDQGFSIFGVGPYDASGRSISSAGDVNGDGIDDLLIGAPDADPGGREDAGEAYLIFGKAGGLGDIKLATLTTDVGLKISGAGEDDATGISVRAAGDINGDGYADIVIGAPQFGPATPGNGKAYVIYGDDLTGAVTHLGTDGDDALVGSAEDDSFVGGLGNDTLTGGGGADSFHAGAGDDAIHVSDGSFRRVDGGNGADTMHLDFGGLVDLGNIDGNAATADQTKIQNIETIVTDNGSANQITVHLADVLHIDADYHDVGGAASLDNALKIDGDTNDTLLLDPADGWSAPDTATLSGYAIYAAGNVKIAVDQDIAVAVA